MFGLLARLGRSSVTYAIALFRASSDQRVSDLATAVRHADAQTPAFTFTYKLEEQLAAAYGEMTHVFVDPTSRRPVEIPSKMRKKLAELHVAQ